jgi:hypothetical protein
MFLEPKISTREFFQFQHPTLGMESVIQKVINYRKNWKSHKERMPNEKNTREHILKCRPRGYRTIGSSRERWIEK